MAGLRAQNLDTLCSQKRDELAHVSTGRGRPPDLERDECGVEVDVTLGNVEGPERCLERLRQGALGLHNLMEVGRTAAVLAECGEVKLALWRWAYNTLGMVARTALCQAGPSPPQDPKEVRNRSLSARALQLPHLLVRDLPKLIPEVFGEVRQAPWDTLLEANLRAPRDRRFRASCRSWQSQTSCCSRTIKRLLSKPTQESAFFLSELGIIVIGQYLLPLLFLF